MIRNPDFFVLAHNIRSLHNVGAIFRSGDVFGVSKLFLTGYTGHPPDEKLSKVALGADKTVPWEHNKSAVRLIKRLRLLYPNLTVVGLDNNLPAASKGRLSELPGYKPKFPLLLVLGEEVAGIPRNVSKLCDEYVEIPQYGTKESLNVSVAFGVAAYAIATAV